MSGTVINIKVCQAKAQNIEVCHVEFVNSSFHTEHVTSGVVEKRSAKTEGRNIL